MKIIVKAKPRSKHESVERIDQPTLGLSGSSHDMPQYKVCVKEPPIDGKANDALVRALSVHFGVPRTRIRLVSGATAKTKIFEIED